MAPARDDNWADAEFCHRRLAVTSWDEHRLWQGAINNTAGPPFSTRASHLSNTQYLEFRRQDVIARMTPDSPARDRQLYEEALAAAPEDTLLRSRFAQYLEATGSRADAIKEFQRVCDCYLTLSGLTTIWATSWFAREDSAKRLKVLSGRSRFGATLRRRARNSAEFKPASHRRWNFHCLQWPFRSRSAQNANRSLSRGNLTARLIPGL
jgi:hypothetical protein